MVGFVQDEDDTGVVGEALFVGAPDTGGIKLIDGIGETEGISDVDGKGDTDGVGVPVLEEGRHWVISCKSNCSNCKRNWKNLLNHPLLGLLLPSPLLPLPE